MSPDRQARWLLVFCAGLFVLSVAGVWIGRPAWWESADPDSAATIGMSLAAAVSAFVAWRHARTPAVRRTWLLFLTGAALNLIGDTTWTLATLAGHSPESPHFADAAWLAVYALWIPAGWRLLAPPKTGAESPETLLDTALLTLIAAGIVVQVFLAPLARGATALPQLLVAGTYVVGGMAIVWVILVQMLRRARFPIGWEGIATAGLALFGLADVLYGSASLPQPLVSTVWVNLAWLLGFLLICSAAARFLTVPQSGPIPEVLNSPYGPRLLALLVGLLALIAVGVHGALSPVPEPLFAVLLAAAGLILAARFSIALLADRRYAALLEREVARQTQSLSNSLAAAAAAERNTRLVLEASPDPIALLDRAGGVLDANPAALVLLGARTGESGSASMLSILDPPAAAAARDHLAAAFDGEIRRFELPYTRPDGTRGIVAAVLAPIREGPLTDRVLLGVRDISEIRRAESQLAQAEKLAALGQMVSGVAHEINNPAAIISGFAQTLLREQIPEEHRESLQMMLDEAHRIGRITQNLLAFARTGSPERTQVGVNELVRRTHALRAYRLGTNNVEVVLELDPDEPTVWGAPSELQQVLLNLLINAEQAVLGVSAPRRILLRTRRSNGEVVMEVADTGPGIPPEIRTRIFEPFFTTKPEGIGTGLGLSICHGIIHGHGGRIWLEPGAGPGARFCVSLPTEQRTEPRPGVSTGATGAGAGPPISVVVVDDEPGLRKAVTRYLNRCGMRVQAAVDGAEALRLVRTLEVDALICDVRMPGMDGRALLDWLRRERPDLVSALILATGDTSEPDTVSLLSDAGVPWLAKPFDFDALEQMVRQVAAARRGGPSVPAGG